MLNGAKLRELYYRVLSEGANPLPQADMMYLLGETESNQDSVLDRASEFSGLIGITGIQAISGYPGGDAWVSELKKRWVPRGRIVLTDSLIEINGKKVSHTLSEMRAVARYAKEHAIETIVLVAPRFHLLRAFMSGIQAVTECCRELKLYPALGTPLPWDEESLHSQGTLEGIRADFIFEETNRIYTYHAQGNLPDPESVLAYMDRRDAV